jgi:hypothetical protein
MTTVKEFFRLLRRKGPVLVLALLVTIFFWTGLIGLNFGRHWDEALALEEITRPVETGVFLPRSYNYASMLFDIGTIALLPRTVPFLISTAKESPPSFALAYRDGVPESEIATVIKYAKGETFHLRLRLILLMMSTLTGVWVFFAVRACKRSGWEAAFAAAVILTSWEIAYHSRWIAPDAVQMQFGALWLMMFTLALNSATRPLVWLRLSSAAAGLAAGTKYQGAFLLFPVIVYAVMLVRASGAHTAAIAKEVLWNFIVFLIVFVSTTPGIVLDPWNFWQSIRHISQQYSTGHFGYTVSPFGEHGYLLLGYLSCVLTSPWLLPALFVFLLSLLGVTLVWKNRPAVAMLLLAGPLLYGLFAISFRVMIVRNYLLLAPFIAFFSARGAYCLWQRLVLVWARAALVLCLVGLFAANSFFLWFAARTILPQPVQRAQDAIAYIREHSRERFYLSRVMTELLTNADVTLPNTTDNPNIADRFLFHSDEMNRTKMLCNRPRLYRQVSGRLEVNFNYYAGWEGQGKIFDVSMKRALELRLIPQEY